MISLYSEGSAFVFQRQEEALSSISPEVISLTAQAKMQLKSHCRCPVCSHGMAMMDKSQDSGPTGCELVTGRCLQPAEGKQQAGSVPPGVPAKTGRVIWRQVVQGGSGNTQGTWT